MIGNLFIRPIEEDNSRAPEGRLDPRVAQALQSDVDPPICLFTKRPIQGHLPFRTVRSILRGRQEGTGIVYPRTEEQTNLITNWARHYTNPQETRTISPLEDEIEQYVFNQWVFAVCNTFFAVDDLQYRTQLEQDARDYPAHLGYSWHLCKSPQEIYQIAEQITSICEVLEVYNRKPSVTAQLTTREVNKCVEELQGLTQLWGNFSRTRTIALANYLSLPYADSETTLQGWWSVVPAIIIKRHRLLAFRYRDVPAIDDFRELVVQALHRRNSLEPRVEIQGSWADNGGLLQADLLYIPLPPRSKA